MFKYFSNSLRFMVFFGFILFIYSTASADNYSLRGPSYLYSNQDFIELAKSDVDYIDETPAQKFIYSDAVNAHEWSAGVGTVELIAGLSLVTLAINNKDNKEFQGLGGLLFGGLGVGLIRLSIDSFTGQSLSEKRYRKLISISDSNERENYARAEVRNVAELDKLLRWTAAGLCLFSGASILSSAQGDIRAMGVGLSVYGVYLFMFERTPAELAVERS